MDANKIIEKAKKLGIKIDEDASTGEKLRQIADEMGVNDFSELESALDDNISGNSSPENLYNQEQPEQIENLEDYPQEQQQKQGIGEKQYQEAKNEGNGDKDYFKKKGEEAKKEVDENQKKLDEAKKARDEAKAKRDQTRNNNGQNIDRQAARNANRDYKKANKEAKQAQKNLKTSQQNVRRANIDDKLLKINKGLHPVRSLKDAAGNKAKELGKKGLKKAGQAAGKAGKTAAKAAGKAAASAGKALGGLIAKGVGALLSNPYVLAGLAIIALIILIIVLIMGIFSDGNAFSAGLYGYDYVEPPCKQITIKGGDYAGTYEIEEYIAGVTMGEFGVFLNDTQIEAAKAGAIAARSYVMARIGEDCKVESNQGFQVYREPNELAKVVANETRGLVLTDSSGNIKVTEYDAFCTDSPQNDPNNYIVCQKNQLVPKSWADSKSGIDSDWKLGQKKGAHGRGMSQWGAAYLAENGSSWKVILDYYYAEDSSEVNLKSIYETVSFASNYPIDPDNEIYKNLAFLTDNSFDNFLSNNGLTKEQFDNLLYTKIEAAGIGTREAVATAAVTLIGSLAEMNVKLNYQWGGKYYQLGTNGSWGLQSATDCENYANRGYDKSICTANYKWSSFDCSGFVNWALINGLQNTGITRVTTSKTNTIPLNSNTAVCNIGGALVSEGHIALVVGYKNDTKQYIVAESRGSRINTGSGGVVLSYYSYGNSHYACNNLDDYYNIENNGETE